MRYEIEREKDKQDHQFILITAVDPLCRRVLGERLKDGQHELPAGVLIHEQYITGQGYPSYRLWRTDGRGELRELVDWTHMADDPKEEASRYLHKLHQAHGVEKDATQCRREQEARGQQVLPLGREAKPTRKGPKKQADSPSSKGCASGGGFFDVLRAGARSALAHAKTAPVAIGGTAVPVRMHKGLGLAHTPAGWSVVHVASGFPAVEGVTECHAGQVLYYLVEYSGVDWREKAPVIRNAPLLQQQVAAIVAQDPRPFASFVAGETPRTISSRRSGCNSWTTTTKLSANWTKRSSGLHELVVEGNAVAACTKEGKAWSAYLLRPDGERQSVLATERLEPAKAGALLALLRRRYPGRDWVAPEVSVVWDETAEKGTFAARLTTRDELVVFQDPKQQWSWLVKAAGVVQSSGQEKGRAGAMAAAARVYFRL